MLDSSVCTFFLCKRERGTERQREGGRGGGDRLCGLDWGRCKRVDEACLTLQFALFSLQERERERGGGGGEAGWISPGYLQEGR